MPMKAKLVVSLLLLQVTFLFAQTSMDRSEYKNWQVIDLKVDTNGALRWKTVNEPNKATITIQQFRWNKWVNVGHIKGQGDKSNTYEYRITPHSGENMFRVGYSELALFSKSMRVCPTIRNVNLGYRPYDRKVQDSIWLPDTSMYEIYDAYGTIVMKGRVKSISVKKLKRGAYYINYDKEMGKFLKK